MSTALVLIDLQNDYFPRGAMELVGAQAAAAQAAELVQTFRQSALPIFHVQHLARKAGATFFLPGTTGAEIHASVSPAEGEAVVVKHYPNSFRETTLHDLLRSVNASRLVVAGMMTHMCVDTTVRAAADFGFECFLAGDACATRNLQFASEHVQARDVQLALPGCPGRHIRHREVRSGVVSRVLDVMGDRTGCSSATATRTRSGWRRSPSSLRCFKRRAWPPSATTRSCASAKDGCSNSTR